MTLKVVSFHTLDERYTKFAERLSASCKAVNQPYVIMPMKQHFPTWVEMVSLKPLFMLRAMRILAMPLVWIDCDAVLKAPLDLLQGIDVDFAIYAKKRKGRRWHPIGRVGALELPKTWPENDFRWFLTGTVFVNNTAGGMDFLREWVRRADEDRRGYQQLICQEAFCAVQPNTLWLPESYCSINGRARPTVIYHDLASCRRPKGEQVVRS